jgi:hypothetical protein
VILKADHIPPPQTVPSSSAYTHKPFIGLAAGLAMNWVFTDKSDGNGGTKNAVFFSAVSLYASVYFKNYIVGGFVSYLPGPKVSDFGVGVGFIERPFKHLDRLTVLEGVRLGDVSPPTEKGPAFTLGIGIDLGRLVLQGCEKKRN